MAKQRREWPNWWEWELELRSYTYKRFQGPPWKVVVEPAPETRRLVVVTAYKVEKLK